MQMKMRWVLIIVFVLIFLPQISAGESITIHLDPPIPTGSDLVHISIFANFGSVNPYFKVYVNRIPVTECTEARFCDVLVGPHPEGLAVLVEYNDMFGNRAKWPEKYFINNNADWDGDGILNQNDNCLFIENPDQLDSDYGGVDPSPSPDGWGDACDNCIGSPNENQMDIDGDHVGDICDNCPSTFNPNPQTDSDGDYVGDVCDNCPGYSNTYQRDFDSDGIGDTCDCADHFMGDQENGADCGGICPLTCEEKYSFCFFGSCSPSKVVPVIYQGSKKDNIDVVFIMDEDFAMQENLFHTWVMGLAYDPITGNAITSTPPIDQYASRFNFWYYDSASATDVGNYEEMCKFHLPQDFWDEAAFADMPVILYTEPGRACSSGSLISSGFHPRTLVHETGHHIFGLGDEYCCDGGYSSRRNIWSSLTSCQDNSLSYKAGVSQCWNYCPKNKCDWADLPTCRQFATDHGLDPNKCKLDGMVCSPNWCDWRGEGWRECCNTDGSGYWKADSSACIMGGGSEFQYDCTQRIQTLLAAMRSSSSTASAASLKAANTRIADSSTDSMQVNDNTGIALLTYHIREGVVTLEEAHMIQNAPPGTYLDSGPFMLVGRGEDGQVLEQIFFEDPREMSLADQKDYEQGMMMGDDFDFVKIIPVDPGMKTIEVVETDTGQVLNSYDMTGILSEYCNQAAGQDPLCPTTPTTISYTGETTGQYSDLASLSALLVDEKETPVSGREISFMLGTQSATATTGLNGVASASLALSQGSGSYTVTASFAGDESYGSSSDSDTFTITKEDAMGALCDSNPAAIQVANAGGSSGTFTLCVKVEEMEPDLPTVAGAAGDINLAQVFMQLVPIGPGSPVSGSCTPSVTGTGYNAISTVTCTFNNVPVNTYSVLATIGGNYYTGSREDVFTVYDPSLGFTSGGGWFNWPGTDDRTNFGFTMKYNKKGTNPQGSILLIRHLPYGSIYRIKSNALNGLALGEDASIPMGWATFSGKGTYLGSGMTEPVGNYLFKVYVEDRNEPGKGIDRFWISVTTSTNQPTDLLMPGTGSGNALTIIGGNIVVPHKSSAATITPKKR